MKETVSEKYHEPVLLSEAIDSLQVSSGKVFVDATFGGGGYTSEILERLPSEGKVLAFDKDIDSQKNVLEDNRLIFINNDYRYIKNYCEFYGYEKVSGIVADLGMSSYQMDVSNRGFSYRFQADLDMRMSQGDKGVTAADILSEYSECQLQEMFSRNGEVRNSKTLAKQILKVRSGKKIKTTSDLLEIANTCFVKGNINRYLAQIFQALRIEVNQELEGLKEFLISGTDLLSLGGRFVVVTYHSLEDRIVKQYFKNQQFSNEPEKDIYGNSKCRLKPVFKKVILADKAEVKKNPRARSAKMRVVEKI